MPKAAKKTTTIQNDTDPILKLIADADRRLDEFHKTSKAEGKIRSKIGEHIVETPFRFGDLHRGLGFASIELIEGQSKLAAERATSVIKNARRQLRQRGISAAWRVQLGATIVREQGRLERIAEAKAVLLEELRREQARLSRLWKRTGFRFIADRARFFETRDTDSRPVWAVDLLRAVRAEQARRAAA